jgi:hypothetical protein
LFSAGLSPAGGVELGGVADPGAVLAGVSVVLAPVVVPVPAGAGVPVVDVLVALF